MKLFYVICTPAKRSFWTGRHMAGPFPKAEAIAEAKLQRSRRVYGRVYVEEVKP